MSDQTQEMQELNDILSETYLAKFAQTLDQRGYGHLTEDEDLMALALRGVETIDSYQKEAAAEVRPYVESNSVKFLRNLVKSD